MIVLAWLRKWGTWIIVGVLFGFVGILWLMLRALKARAEAHALADTVIDLGREADAAYARAKGDAAGEQVDAIETEIKDLVQTLGETLARREAEHADPQKMDEPQLVAELRRRFGSTDGDGI